MVPPEKNFTALRASKLSKVVPLDVFGMVPGTVTGVTV